MVRTVPVDRMESTEGGTTEAPRPDNIHAVKAVKGRVCMMGRRLPMWRFVSLEACVDGALDTWEMGALDMSRAWKHVRYYISADMHARWVLDD